MAMASAVPHGEAAASGDLGSRAAAGPETLSDLAEATITVSSALPGSSKSGQIRIPLLRVAKPQDQQRKSKQCDLWAFVWTASSVLADIVATMQSQLSAAKTNRPVSMCEIGAGCGLASIVAATNPINDSGSLVFSPVVATDAVKDALTLIALNASRAHAGLQLRDDTGPENLSQSPCPHLRTAQLDWHKGWASLTALPALPSPAEGDVAEPLPSPRSFDVVMGSDVLFLSSNARPILKMLQEAWAVPPLPTSADARACSCPPFALLVDPGRPGREELEDLAVDYGLRVERYDAGSGTATGLMTGLGIAMRECTVMILTPQPQAAAAAGSAGETTVCPHESCARRLALEAARVAVAAVLRRGSELAAAAAVSSSATADGSTTTPATATKAAPVTFGYTLPSV